MRRYCPTCGELLSQGASVNGKAKFFCINRECPNVFQTIADPTPEVEKEEEPMTFKHIKEAVARGWTHETTKDLVLDPDLAEAIAEEVAKIDIEANLGCATTWELINELHARADIAKTLDEEWVLYKTLVKD